jgi:hypothetical protein
LGEFRFTVTLTVKGGSGNPKHGAHIRLADITQIHFVFQTGLVHFITSFEKICPPIISTGGAVPVDGVSPVSGYPLINEKSSTIIASAL